MAAGDTMPTPEEVRTYSHPSRSLSDKSASAIEAVMQAARETMMAPRWENASGERTERFLSRVRAVARECGYAVTVHGSLKFERDLDLVAVPWTPEAVSADQLIARLCEDVPLVERPCNLYADPDGPRVEPNPERKPWGRIGWSLAGCPEHRYVDLSVAPRCGEPVPL
jgi:hypothetical protein